MKPVDDTDPTESESEAPEWFLIWVATYFSERIEKIERRIANLETQRTPQDENPDPEWFS